MSRFRILLLLFIVIFVGACSNQPTSTAVNTLYCDRYLLYRMCALDASGDGQTDFVYFEDSREIFLFDPQQLTLVPPHLTLHECAQSMDQPLIGAASLVLTINEDMGFMRRTEIKNGILYHYLRYIPRVNRCNRALAKGNEPAEVEDDFGVTENEDF